MDMVRAQGTKAGSGSSDYAAFLHALSDSGFEGELTTAAGQRITLATDNSIYQIPPDAVAFPRNADDLTRIMALLDRPEFGGIVIRPRGGGTGTNGQSLGHGLVVDCSRNMTRILEINAAEGWVRVEPGVIKDQLNRALVAHRLFFAPELSTSSRATIGGMISTDASGQGSCLYGKTSDHVIGLRVALLGGEMMQTGAVAPETLPGQTGRAGDILRVLDQIAQDNAALIAERFPKMNRSLTGYDLAHIRQEDGRVDAKAVICGAEGTLALIAEAKLRVLRIPKHAVLVNIFYDDFNAGLRDGRFLVTTGAASVETMDSRVLGLARGDIGWQGVAALFPDDGTQGVNMVEFTGDDPAAVEAAAQGLVSGLTLTGGRRGSAIARGGDVGRVWDMRKKAVGLLGRVASAAKPLAFVEDCAVPPEELADFILGFRAILDDAGLDYGMFGHVDAGVLHVRPALDLTDPAVEPRIREITRKVHSLARKHGGLLWGEHGKGLRSEFVPEVFGPLYPALQQIKAAFDPRNQLNPGKIAAPAGGQLTPVDAAPLRGQADRQIAPEIRAQYANAFACNGNGACFSQLDSEVMCPSYKATRDRRHSPKGRADLMREWLRQSGPEGQADQAFEAEVKDAMDGCLSCRACASACPVHVDIPTLRARFLEAWHRRHRRPLRDFALAGLEQMLPLMAALRPLGNLMLGRLGAPVLRRFGLVNLPLLARRTGAMGGARVLRGAEGLTAARDVIIVPDAFTRHFEPDLVSDLVAVIETLGFTAWLAPYRSSGKPRHVLGMLRGYRRQAQEQAALLAPYGAQGIPMIGLEPAIALAFDKDPDANAPPRILLPQEWLVRHLSRIPGHAEPMQAVLLSHCTETTERPKAKAQWQEVLAKAGISLQTPNTGCCGMAGTWGHLRENAQTSATIFSQSWGPALQAASQGGPAPVLATGFSCRCQAKHLAGETLVHPIHLLRLRICSAMADVTRN
jgi:FAD/FMN-containing dehydrogenase/Fe-S oxidoreductase